MPRKTKRKVVLQRCDPTQPPLFDEDGFPTRAAVLSAVAARSYEHVGVRLVEDDALALRLVELLVMNWGTKRIAREMHISPHTVRAAKRLLVAQGKMAPLKERVLGILDEITEVGAARYLDGLESGAIPAVQIPVGWGIMFDKKQLLRGEPTSISASQTMPAELSVEAINRVLDSLPILDAGPNVVVESHKESQSLGNAMESQQNKGNGPLAASLAATEDRTDTPPITEPATAPAKTQPEGGGGGSTANAVARPDPTGSEN
jgi:hypothetical protein